MSTFSGKLLEKDMEFIRIDNFQAHNYDGTSFFLSHCHTDHLAGIFDLGFLNVLKQNDNAKLYCSAFTKSVILANRHCSIPDEKIFVMNTNTEYLLSHKDVPPVQVAALPAGHCPGSFMFLFEQKNGLRVLYTGDFRINSRDLTKFDLLNDNDGVKKIDRLYLDTTFCDPKWLKFPQRSLTTETMLNLVNNWLDVNSKHRVGIWYNSNYGLEYILLTLARSLRTRVWAIDPKTWKHYSSIPELGDVLTREKGDSRIHLCPNWGNKDCFECNLYPCFMKRLKPCAMSFDTKQLEEGVVKEGRSVTRVVYSTHCSLEELIGVVNYLNPQSIVPCVIPPHLTQEQVLNNLKLDPDALLCQAKQSCVQGLGTTQLSQTEGMAISSPIPPSIKNREVSRAKYSEKDIKEALECLNSIPYLD